LTNYKHKYLLFLIQGFILVLLTSCSNVDSTEVDHSFEVAINVGQSIEEFNNISFEPFDDLNLGFFKGKLWIKLEVKNTIQPNSYMIINNDMINRNYTFYKLDSLNNSLKLVNQIKDKSKQDHRTNNISNPNFKVDLGANEQATYLILTISDGRTVDATPKLISMTNYSNLTTENMTWSIVFLGSIIFLLLLNIYQWSIYKQQIYFYYIFYMLSTFLMYVALEGKLFNFGIKHVIIDHIVFLSVRLWVLTLIIYTSKFLKIQVVYPIFDKFIKWTLFLVLGGTTLYQFSFYNTSIAHLHYFENILSFLWLLLILGIVLVSTKTRKLELKYYLIPLCCLLFFITIGLIDGHFQILPGSPFVYIKIGTIVEFLGFTYFMAILIKRKLERSEKLEKELHVNRKELIITSEKLEEKDKLLSTKIGIEKTDIVSIFKLLENSLSTEAEWSEFKLKFKELNPNFLNQLLVNHPDLSKSDVRLLTLIKIGYSQKEIANILSIAPDSVKKARSRVRKKLTLPENNRLKEYLQNL
jgi:DNA-binding CsgD family transcriptional regulator